MHNSYILYAINTFFQRRKFALNLETASQWESIIEAENISPHEASQGTKSGQLLFKVELAMLKMA